MKPQYPPIMNCSHLTLKEEGGGGEGREGQPSEDVHYKYRRDTHIILKVHIRRRLTKRFLLRPPHSRSPP